MFAKHNIFSIIQITLSRYIPDYLKYSLLIAISAYVLISKNYIDWLNELYVGYSISLILAHLFQLLLLPLVAFRNMDHSDFAQDQILRSGVILKDRDYSEVLNNIGVLSFAAYLIIAALYYYNTNEIFDSLGIALSAFSFLELVNANVTAETKKNIIRSVTHGAIASGVCIFALVSLHDGNFQPENKAAWAYLTVLIFYVIRFLLFFVKRYFLN